MKLITVIVVACMVCILQGFLLYGQGFNAKVYEHKAKRRYTLAYFTPLKCEICFNFIFDRTAKKLCPSFGYGVVKKEIGPNSLWVISCRDPWGWYDRNQY